MLQSEQEPRVWFEEAVRCYSECHQGCPWCGGANRVYRSQVGSMTEYRCGDCDFVAYHDQLQKRYFVDPGRQTKAPDTMEEI